MLSYSIAGYALFGIASKSFATILMSFVTNFKILVGKYQYSEIYDSDTSISVLYHVTFLIVFRIGLLNMFISIIVAHYIEFMKQLKE